MEQNKLERMEEFLQFIADLARQNPLVEEFKNRDIYALYVRQGVTRQDRQHQLDSEGLFDNWIEHFDKEENIDVFVDDNWTYFCQFINKPSEILSKSDQIKMYVPLDYDHIKIGAQMLFEFLAHNDIQHISKIGRHIRCDDIVIRVGNSEDAKKILDFINNNNYIKEGLISANPFNVSKDNIAFASDNKLSYSSVVSAYITLYINEKIRNQELDSVCLNDFIKTSAKNYRAIFNTENLEMAMRAFNKKEVTVEDFENYKEISKLFFLSCNPEFTFDDYIYYFNNKVALPSYNIVDLQAILKETLKIMGAKYGNDLSMRGLTKCFERDDYSAITRDNNLRRRLVDIDFSKRLQSELKRKNIGFSTFVLSVKRSILNDAIITTYKKYGDDNGALAGLLCKGTYGAFTRDEGTRSILEGCVNPKEAYNIVCKGYSGEIRPDLLAAQYSNSIIEIYNKNLESEATAGKSI